MGEFSLENSKLVYRYDPNYGYATDPGKVVITSFPGNEIPNIQLLDAGDYYVLNGLKIQIRTNESASIKDQERVARLFGMQVASPDFNGQSELQLKIEPSLMKPVIVMATGNGQLLFD